MKRRGPSWRLAHGPNQCSGINYRIKIERDEVVLEGRGGFKESFKLEEVRSVELVRKNAILPGTVAVISAITLALLAFNLLDLAMPISFASKLLAQTALAVASILSGALAVMAATFADLRVRLVGESKSFTIRLVKIKDGLRFTNGLRRKMARSLEGDLP